jgi:hypothetical protein
MATLGPRDCVPRTQPPPALRVSECSMPGSTIGTPACRSQRHAPPSAACRSEDSRLGCLFYHIASARRIAVPAVSGRCRHPERIGVPLRPWSGGTPNLRAECEWQAASLPSALSIQNVAELLCLGCATCNISALVSRGRGRPWQEQASRCIVAQSGAGEKQRQHAAHGICCLGSRRRAHPAQACPPPLLQNVAVLPCLGCATCNISTLAHQSTSQPPYSSAKQGVPEYHRNTLHYRRIYRLCAR